MTFVSFVWSNLFIGRDSNLPFFNFLVSVIFDRGRLVENLKEHAMKNVLKNGLKHPIEWADKPVPMGSFRKVDLLEEVNDLPIEHNPYKTDKVLGGFEQWMTSDDKRFFPASRTVAKLPPGVYEIQQSNSGLYFERIAVQTTGLLRFPQTNSEKVVKEIQTFWNTEATFKDYDIIFRRGIILYGPPGGGKTSSIQFIMRDVIERGGIVVKFTHPGLFNDGMRVLRTFEGDTPVVVLMEDIDSIIQNYSESEVLNILDGINQIRKAVYLATPVPVRQAVFYRAPRRG